MRKKTVEGNFWFNVEFAKYLSCLYLNSTSAKGCATISLITIMSVVLLSSDHRGFRGYKSLLEKFIIIIIINNIIAEIY